MRPDGLIVREAILSNRKEMRLGHVELYVHSPSVKSYLDTPLPRTVNKYNAGYVWVPSWLWNLSQHLFYIGGNICHGLRPNERENQVLECTKYIYENEDLRAKYSSLYALDPGYDLRDELIKDISQAKNLVGL